MFRDKPLHFVSMDTPFPPSYGGVIDVFFKLQAFHQLGVKVYLHVFGFKENKESGLEKYAEKVYYYPIKQNPFLVFNKSPFSVCSRNGNKLFENITKIDAPIFFESLKTTDIIRKFNLSNQKKYLRLHNIEQNYFEGLALSETNIFKRVMYYLEAKKYIKYEPIMSHFDQIFTLSNYEQDYIYQTFSKGKFIPVFHGNNTFFNLKGCGHYALYHGDLRAADNRRAVEFLIDVFNDIDYPLIIASSSKQAWVEDNIVGRKNIKFIYLEDFKHLLTLFKNAQMNISWSFQQSGTKLKVVNALFNSRYSIINDNVIDDDHIRQLCIEVKNKKELIEQINLLKNKPFIASETYKSILETYLNDRMNAENILNEIFS